MNEATVLLKKQLPSVKKLLRRKTIEREVMTINKGANSVTTQVSISQSKAQSSLYPRTKYFVFSQGVSLVTKHCGNCVHGRVLSSFYFIVLFG